MLTDNKRRTVITDTAGNPAPVESSIPHSRFLFEPDDIMERLRARIVGQDQALAEIATALQVIKANVGDPRRPLYVALLMGPTGVGKTETVRLLTEVIHGNSDAFCRVDMNTLAQDHYAAALTGAPPGYVGSKEGTTLLNPELIQGSFSRPGIVLFDEIEKAGKEVIGALLNVLDHGHLTLTSGTATIDFRNSMIFMTSNLGARDVQQYEDSLRRGWRSIFPPSAETRRRRVHALVDAALHKRFDPEFVNRIDRVVLYNWIERDVLDALIDLELGKLNSRLAAHRYRLELSEDARSLLKREGFDRRFGARAMCRAFRHHVEAGLAETLAHPDIGRRVRGASCRIVGEAVDGGLRFRLTVD
jgi:ATP-dependent Clp protease ATP-binding subunit ClpA